VSGPEDPSAAGLRHALRTPLNHIIGYGEMLLEDLESTALHTLVFEARETVRIVQNSFQSGEDVASASDLQALREELVPRVGRMRTAVAQLREVLPEKSGSDLAKIDSAV